MPAVFTHSRIYILFYFNRVMTPYHHNIKIFWSAHTYTAPQDIPLSKELGL